MEGMFLRLPPMQEQCIYGYCVHDLEFKSMTNLSQGQQRLKNSMQKQVAYMWKFPSQNSMYSSGGNSSFVIQELIMQHFFVFFSKSKSPELQCHQEQDKQQIRPSQTQIKHMLSTNFKFRANPYIRTILSKTQENSRLKTRYLKGNTTEQLFIISIQEIILSPHYLFNS